MIRSVPVSTAAVALCLVVLASWLRLEGLTRGEMAPLGPTSARAFHHFHPDEYTVIEAALSPFDPLGPEVTVYGMLPIYLLRGAVELASAARGWELQTLADADTKRRVFYTARTVSALVASLTVGLILLLGLRFFDPVVAAFAALVVAVAPISIQQAHFYTVDGLYLLCVVASTYAAFAAFDSMRGKWFALCGVLVGLTASVRLSGLLLGLVLLLALLLRLRQQQAGGGDLKNLLRAAVRFPGLSLSCGAAALTVVALQPYLLFNPEVLWRQSLMDLGTAILVARGDLLQPWTLADLHTVPYWHHWRSLWPLAVGWPMTLLVAAGLGYGLCRLSCPKRAFLTLWCIVYFAPVGGLHAKHVRYLLPMLPALSLLAGGLWVWMWRRRGGVLRWIGVVLAGGAAVHAVVYGVAFAGIYSQEDSRLQASRWLARNVPAGATIGVERGGFSMGALVDGGRYQKRFINASGLFYAAPYMLCRTQVEFLRQRLSGLDYIALVDVNRRVQFAGAPELYPAVAAVYDRLFNGRLGFAVAARLKVRPVVLGLEFGDDGAEASFLGYDHPTATVLRRLGESTVDAACASMTRALQDRSECLDRPLQGIALSLQQGDLPAAATGVRSLLAEHPQAKLAHRLQAEVYRRLGDRAREEAAWQQYSPENATGATAHVRNSQTVHMTPGATALSLVDLGLHDVAIADLTRAVELGPGLSRAGAREMAESYAAVGSSLFHAGFPSQMEEAFELSLRIHPTSQAYNVLAKVVYSRDEIEQAVSYWEQSLTLDPAQSEAHTHAGMVSLIRLGDYSRAIGHLESAIALDPTRAGELQQRLDEARRLDRERLNKAGSGPD